MSQRNSDIITVTVHNSSGRELGDRMRANSTEKNKGALMIDRQKDLFGFASYKEIEDIVLEESKREKDRNGKIEWKRDKYGNPTSPFKGN